MTLPTALQLAQQIQDGHTTATQVLETCLAQIAAKDSDVNGFNALYQETARQTAEAVDAKAKAGDTLPLLAGVPIALKDNIHVTGQATTCSSKILDGYVAPYSATVSEKLAGNLLPVVGKTNLDEFAMGSSTENSANGPSRNPWDTSRVPGGSSGGSAAVVSAGMVPLALGSDTGGSVRQPAALCGIVGLKPTYGLVSRYGLVAFGSSLDQISPFARTVCDCAAILQVISGPDPLDSTSLHSVQVPNYLQTIHQGIEGLRIGVIEELQGEGFAPAVSQSMAQAIDTLKILGATVVPISIPAIEYAIAAYYIVATAEASSNLGRFDGVRYGLRVETPGSDLHTMYRSTRSAGFGPEVKRRIMLGTFCLSAGYFDAYYGKAQKVRELLRRQFAQAFGQVDLLISPTSPTTAFKIGEKADNPVQMYLSDVASIPVNMAGIPAMSIPCGFDDGGLPIGLQLLAPHLGEERMLQAAYAFEQQTGLSNLAPPMAAALA